MNERPWSKLLLWVILPAIVLVFYISAASHFSYSPDDTYIYCQFAKNLVHGNGFSFNAGEPTYGFTSPLWLGIIALGGKMKVDLVMAAKVIDLVFASLSLVLFYGLAYEILRDFAVALCATVAFSVNAWLVRWAGSGMETSLAVFLVLAVFWFCLRNEYFLSIIVAALLTLVRPEAALIVPLIFIDVYVNSFSKRRAFNLNGALLLIYAVIIAPWLLYAYMAFGTIVPNTAYAKAGLHLTINELVLTSWDIIKTISVTDGLAIAVIFLCGISILMRKKSHDDENESFFVLRQSLIGLGWILIVPLFYLITDVNVVSRYLLLISPLITILAFFYLYKLISSTNMRRHAYTAVFILTAFILFQNQFIYRRYILPGIVSFQTGMETCLIPIGKWLKENTSPEAKIIIGDVGAVGYYSERTICDAAGLITPAMLPLIRKGELSNTVIEKKLYKDVCAVDYVIHRSDVSEQLKGDPELIPVVTLPFYGMTLGNPELIYYTVYQVKSQKEKVKKRTSN